SALMHDEIGKLSAMRGQLTEAEASFRARLAIFERLAHAAPGNMRWQRDLAISYDRMGRVLAEQGNRMEALKYYLDNLAIAERIAAAEPNDPYSVPAIAYARNNLCWTRAILGELEAALADCNESLRLRPNDAGTLDSRGLIYLKMG